MARYRTLITAVIQLALGAVILFVSFKIIRVPFEYYIIGTAAFLFIISIIVGFKWWRIGNKYPTYLSVFNTLLITVAAFLIGGLGFVWDHGLFVNNPPIIENFFANNNPLEPGESTMLEVNCRDDECDPISFMYKPDAGTIPLSFEWVQEDEIEYTAPKDKTGNFAVTVTVHDNVERESYPYDTLYITVAWKASKIREYNEEGLTDLKGERYDSAIKSFDSAIKIIESDAPDFADTYLARGIAEVEIGKPKEALDDFDQFIKLQPYNSIGYLLRATTYEQLDQPGKANADIEEFYSMIEDPDLKELVLNFESASDEERLSILNEAIGNSPNPFPYVWEESTFPLPPPQL